jgi:hypothetical protein
MGAAIPEVNNKRTPANVNGKSLLFNNTTPSKRQNTHAERFKAPIYSAG